MYGYGFVRNDEGKIIYNETTGLPVRPNEVQKIGNAYADWKGGWTNNFKYKNFTLGVTLDGSFGGTLYSQSYHKMMVKYALIRLELMNLFLILTV